MRLPFSIKKRVLGGIVSSLSGLVYNSSVLPLAFFEKNKKCHTSHCLTPCVFWKKKKKNDTILSLFESLMESLLSCARYICVCVYIYIFISATHVFSLVLSPTQLLSFLLFRLLLSPLRLRTQSLISHQPPSFFFQTLIPLNKH